MIRALLRWLGRLGVACLALIALLFIFGPYEEVEMPEPFDHDRLEGGITPYIKAREAQAANLRRGNEMRVAWYGLEEVPTDLAIVYIHGFSASAEEIRPVPDLLGEALRANVVYTRLSGHGRDGAAMAEPTASDWLADTAEALTIGRAVGREVLILSTSMGGTLAALAATDPEMARDLKGVVLISPNFGINSPAAPLLSLPAARYCLPMLAGESRSFEPINDLQAQHWTTAYPSVAVFPMAALVRFAVRRDYSAVRVPALFYYAAEDGIVDAAKTDDVRARWGGPSAHVVPDLGDGVDPYAHVVAGDILSPANTDRATEVIMEWVATL